MARRPLMEALGSPQQEMQRQIGLLERGVTEGVRTASTGLQSALRAESRRVLGPKVANAWRRQVYPGTGASAKAAALVYSKAPDIVRAFNEGATIRSADGFWLAIPTPAAPKRGVGGKRINPSNFPEARFGPLRFVYRPGKAALLVVDGLRARTGKRGGFGRAGKRALARGETTTVVMFVLVPQVRLTKRLDIEGAARTWQRRLPALIGREIVRLNRPRN